MKRIINICDNCGKEVSKEEDDKYILSYCEDYKGKITCGGCRIKRGELPLGYDNKYRTGMA